MKHVIRRDTDIEKHYNHVGQSTIKYRLRTPSSFVAKKNIKINKPFD